MVKNYLLDTNILMSNANAIFGFEDNNVYLCGTVLQELDKHKKDEGERGYNAREALRTITNLIKNAIENISNQEERLSIVRDKGIDLGNGGKLFFEPDGVDIANLPKGYDINVPDNRIISSCVHMNKHYLKDSPVTLLTNDGGCFINSLICGVNADTVRNEEVEYIGYSGHLNLEIADWNIINEIHKNNEIEANKIPEIGYLDYPLYENQFVTITCGNQSALTVYQKGIIHKIDDMIVHENI